MTYILKYDIMRKKGDEDMSCFKRAEWSSGLTYQHTCDKCGNVMIYKDNLLDFRPWYPDGFVYCSRCKTPLRHSERLAIDAPVAPSSPMASDTPAGSALFCSQCGKKFESADRFCSGCGAKRM